MKTRLLLRPIGFLWLCALLFYAPLSADESRVRGVLHAIVVGDLDSKDIQHAIRYDLRNVSDELNRIGYYTDLAIDQKQFAGKTARTAKIIQYIEDLQVDSNDLIVFYFSGHGYRTSSKGSDPWPNLYFDTEKVGINLTDIVDLLQEKNARLTVVLADCCNNVLSEKYAPPLVKKALTVANKRVNLDQAYSKLFVETQGFIVAAGCRAEQTSLALATGSLYTLSFLSSLQDTVKGSPLAVTWQDLLDKASYKTDYEAKRYNDEQEPIFSIN